MTIGGFVTPSKDGVANRLSSAFEKFGKFDNTWGQLVFEISPLIVEAFVGACRKEKSEVRLFIFENGMDSSKFTCKNEIDLSNIK